MVKSSESQNNDLRACYQRRQNNGLHCMIAGLALTAITLIVSDQDEKIDRRVYQEHNNSIKYGLIAMATGALFGNGLRRHLYYQAAEKRLINKK